MTHLNATSITPETIRADLENAGIMFVQSPDGDTLDMFVFNNGHAAPVTWGQAVEDYDYDYCLGDLTGTGVELLEFNHMFTLDRADYGSGAGFACAVAHHIGWMGQATSFEMDRNHNH